jgi:hypothetical protein
VKQHRHQHLPKQFSLLLAYPAATAMAPQRLCAFRTVSGRDRLLGETVKAVSTVATADTNNTRSTHVPELRISPLLWRSEEDQRKRRIRQDKLVMLPLLLLVEQHRHQHLPKQFSLLLTCPAAIAMVTQRSVQFV